MFYVGYIVFELPSNMVLKKVGPAIWLSALTGAWGLVTLGIGFSRNWQTVAVCRVFLGIFEAVSTVRLQAREKRSQLTMRIQRVCSRAVSTYWRHGINGLNFKKGEKSLA